MSMGTNTTLINSYMKERARAEWHSYQHEGKLARIFLTTDGFEIDYYDGDELVKTEQHYDKSESWAEDCADNYVQGIKIL